MSVRPRHHPLRLVPLEPEHLAIVLKIERETFASPWTRGAFVREMVEPYSHIFALLRNGSCIGYAGYWLLEDEMHISNVAIAASQRGHGYGRWLLAALLRHGLRRGAQAATLEVRERNVPARGLYDAFDFVVAGRRPKYYSAEGEDALIMWNHDIAATVARLPADLGVPTE